MSTRKRVVIIGGGFGGLNAAQSLAKCDVDVTLIDRRNFHLFQPLLYQVATGGLSPANIAAPIRGVLQTQRNTRVLMDEVTQIDPRGSSVRLKGGEVVGFDYLIVAAGGRNDYFGHPEWEQHAHGMKTVEDATILRRHIFKAFEDAELETDPQRIASLLTFVVVGAGPTGVELAGAIAEIARDTLHQNFRKIDPASARIVLLDGSDRVLPAMHPALSEQARQRLIGLGVDVRLKAKVVRLEKGLVEVECDGQKQVLLAETKIWAAGVRASVLGEILAQACGAQIDRGGRVIVGPELNIPGFENVFVIGDLANAKDKNGKPLPGLATVAIQQGKYVAKSIRARIKSKPVAAFTYFDKGTMATIGRGAAVAQIAGLRIGGWIAWVMWLFIHLMYLVSYSNRILVMVQWGWSYFTFGRSARLITGSEADALTATQLGPPHPAVPQTKPAPADANPQNPTPSSNTGSSTSARLRNPRALQVEFAARSVENAPKQGDTSG